MTSLTARLQRTIQPSIAPGSAPPLMPGPRLMPSPPGTPRRGGPQTSLPGNLESTEHGDLQVLTRRHGLNSQHGAVTVGDWYGQSTTHLSTATGDPRLETLDPRQTLFLDIEATGLDHGAGTYAFILGLGYLDGDAVVVEQLVLREPADERAFLSRLVAHLDRLPFLATFNGKSYDLTVLQSRLIMQRLYTPKVCALKLRPHIDLLHLSRNLYRGLWENTRLGTLERELLGFERHDDLPGHLVPSAWYHFMRTRDTGPLTRAIAHNHDDVLSMVALAHVVCRDSAAGPAAGRCPGVLPNLARLYMRRKRPATALDILDLIEPSALSVTQQAEGLRVGVQAARRLCDRRRQENALRRLVALEPSDHRALIDLAIFEEHTRRNMGAALVAARAAQRLQTSSDLRRRVTRLQRRITGTGRSKSD